LILIQKNIPTIMPLLTVREERDEGFLELITQYLAAGV
jgi:hypothetical protein